MDLSTSVALRGTKASAEAWAAPDGIGVIDTEKLALVKRLPSGSDPEQFSLSNDGKLLFISNEDAASVAIVDLSTVRLTPTRPRRARWPTTTSPRAW